MSKERTSDEVQLTFGQGRISGILAIFLGALSVLAVLCFHFPEWLTTPELRRAYPVEILRWVLLAGMILAVFFGALSLLLSSSKRLGFAGIALALLAQWLGGAHVEVDEFDSPVVSFGFDWLVLALLANSLVFVFIERVWPLHPEQRTLRRGWRLDLAYYAVSHVGVGVVLLATTFFSESLFGWAVNDDLQAVIRSQPFLLQLIEVLFVADLTQYAGHRAMHEIPWLWRFHAVHHCPEEMDWLSGSRMHFFELILIRALVITPVYLLGFSEAAVNAYVIWVGIQGVLIHSNTRIPFGWLDQLVVTPHFHHWHHAADAEAIDRNYAANLPVLDRLFGTYVGNRGRWPERYGVVGKPLPDGFFGQMLYPFMGKPGRG
ncbi:sterol desaturase family protein [Myxococcota bacterium]|nr:sterol desaturase family protein [Myxococcota bacterium]